MAEEGPKGRDRGQVIKDPDLISNLGLILKIIWSHKNAVEQSNAIIVQRVSRNWIKARLSTRG